MYCFISKMQVWKKRKCIYLDEIPTVIIANNCETERNIHRPYLNQNNRRNPNLCIPCNIIHGVIVSGG